ncbi:MAG: asparagine synthase-related protein [Thermoleophilaceae bacterium]
MRTPHDLTPLEAAVGIPFDAADRAASCAARRDASDPAAELERALLAPLGREPCLVTFSGGRDSSAVLSAAVQAARKNGLPEPVAVTLRFRGRPAAEESQWQELVAKSLGLREWERVEVGDELDFVGPLTTERLRRFGPLYPANAAAVVPLAERARGGSLVVGQGGDELFGLWRRRRVADVLAGRARPRLRDPAAVGLAAAPLRLRRSVLRRRAVLDPALTWLTPAARAQLAELEADELAAEPARWSRYAQASVRRRDVTLAVRTLSALAAELDAELHAPLLDPRFTAALARAGGWTGFADRTAAMSAAFNGALPPELLRRTDKATFTEVFWTSESRRFAESWSGSGLDERIVDPEAVRRTWLAEAPDYRTGTLLQAAWLHDRGEAPV